MFPEVKSSILKKMKKLEEVIEILEELKRIPFEEFIKDGKTQAAAMYNLIIGIEAITDVGNYFLAEKFHQAAETYEDIIKGLGEKGIISEDLLKQSEGMARFRNVLVHLYEEVEPEKVYQNLQKTPDIFRQFAKYFQEFLEKT